MDEKYPLEHKRFLADALALHSSQHAIKKFAEHFRIPFNRNMLAGLFHKAGNKSMFVEKYRTKAAVPRKEPALVPPPRAPVAKLAAAAEIGRIIADAYLEWDPAAASFQSANALAAMRVNGKLGTAYRADDIEAVVRKAEGVLELLLDCSVDATIAQRAVQQVKRPKQE